MRIDTPGGVDTDTINDLIQDGLDSLDWQESIKDKDLTAPPGGESEGDRYIVATGGSGAWATHDDDIAVYRDSSWTFITPNEGYRCWVEDEDLTYIYNSGSWGSIGTADPHGASHLYGGADDIGIYTDGSGAPAGAGTDGTFYVNTDNDTLYYSDGVSWSVLASGGISDLDDLADGSSYQRVAASEVDASGYVTQINDGSNVVTAAQARGHIDDAAKHYEINDAGSGLTDLWSASKIGTDLGGKSDTGHTHAHNDTTSIDGGDVGEYFHLTTAQHTALTTNLSETVEDIAGAMWSSNTETGITITYQDDDGTIDAELDSEWVQDLVGAMFSSNTETGITITYQDDDGTIDAEVDAEWISDTVGAMFSSNTETGITVTYQDDDNTIDLVVAYGAEPGAVSSTTSGAAGSNDTASRSDHSHDLTLGGSDTYIQFNDSNALGGESNFTFNKSTETVTLSGPGTIALTGRAYGNIASLSDGASIAVDMSTGQNFTVTLGGNRAMANPSNAVAGQSGVFIIKQDGTGSRTLTWGSYYYFPSGTGPTLTTDASAIDIVPYFCESSTVVHCGAGLLAMAATS